MNMNSDGLKRLIEAIEKKDLIDTDGLDELISNREMFDKNHNTTVIIGRLPADINERAEVVNLWFDEGIDDYITVLEWNNA